MNELQVIIEEKPGTISWNFEELKTELSDQVKVYKTIVYTDETIQDAKKDVAALRKLKAAVEERRKEIKKSWMAPYEELERQAKELVSIIDEPVEIIGEKVAEYEERQRAAREKEIRTYFESAVESLPEEVRGKVLEMKYSARWELKSTPKKVWKGAIDQIVSDIGLDVLMIEDVEEEYKAACMETYANTLSLGKAMEKRRELEKAAETIRAAERKRVEEEQRREREREEAAKRREFVEEARRKAAEERAQTERESADMKPAQAEACEKTEQRIDSTAPEEKPKSGEWTVIRVRGSAEQVYKIVGYAKFIGAECEVEK